MLRAVREIKPQYVVGENVSGLLSWAGGLVFDEVQSDLENEGYQVQPCVLPAASVGAPHKRERIWFIANACDNGERRAPKKNGGESVGERIQERDEIQHPAEPSIILRNVGHSSRLELQRSEQHGGARGTGAGGAKVEHVARPIRTSWEKFPTQPPICGRNDGLSVKLDGIAFSKWRSESIKGYGNAIVPQVAFEIFKALINSELKTTA